jgi:hypothetical protein
VGEGNRGGLSKGVEDGIAVVVGCVMGWVHEQDY